MIHADPGPGLLVARTACFRDVFLAVWKYRAMVAAVSRKNSGVPLNRKKVSFPMVSLTNGETSTDM
jgi:hypothetical protein